MADSIIRSPHPAVEIPDIAVHELVLAAAAQRGDQLAVIDGRSGRTLTYGQLASGVSQVAAGLATRGFAKGDVLAVYAPNLPEYPLAFFGVSVAGGATTMVNPLCTAGELAAQLADAKARFLITVPALAGQALEVAGRSRVQEVFVIGEADGATPFASLLTTTGTPPKVGIEPDRDLVALPYSSGTTGLAKGVMLTHRNMVAVITQFNAILQTAPEDRILAVLPFFHIYGLSLVMAATLRQGATIVTLPRFDLEEFLRTVQDQRITLAYLVPPIVLALAKHPLVDRYDLSTLRLAGCGAAPLDEALHRACAERIGCPVIQGYGLTETSVGVCGNFGAPLGPRPGSVGVLWPNTQARIVDPGSESDLPIGATGELWVRGPQVMRGYLGADQATAAALDSDGWLRTGDLCRVDHDGYVFVVDRLKELIKYKGYQVAPAELEALLLSHPLVSDAAVVRSPDPDAGEVPEAFLVTTEPMDADSLMAWVAERVAPHKRIRRIEFVDQIPKSPTGKVLRRVLLDRDREPPTDHGQAS